MKGEEKGRGFLSRCRQRKVIPGGDGGGSNGGGSDGGGSGCNVPN